jgi:hypothetical protein
VKKKAHPFVKWVGGKMMKENELQEAIVSALEFKGYFVYMNYQNIAGRFAGDSNSSSYGHYRSLVNQGWKKGIPDLHVIGKNIDIYIECKSKKGKISPAQQEVMDTLVHFGREVRVVNDISQIQDLLDMDL